MFFHVDPATAGMLKGSIHFTGKKPIPRVIDMSSDPACVEAHQGKAARRVHRGQSQWDPRQRFCVH